MTILAIDLHIVANDDEPRVQDIRLAEALEFSRPRVIRELIERNHGELERHGKLPCRTAVSRDAGARGPRPEEYWLNEAQALLLCMKSETPRAADVRTEIITIFQAWRHGRLASVPPPVSYGQMELLFNKNMEPVRREVAEARREVADVRRYVERVDGNVTFLSNRIDDIVPRREFSEEAKTQFKQVAFRRHSRFCPCCKSGYVVDENGGSIVGQAHFDHFNGRERNGVQDGWIVCAKCNFNLRDAEFKNRSRPRFEAFQLDRNDLYGQKTKYVRPKRSSKKIKAPGQGEFSF